jgi:hypothetical protein
LLTSLDFAAIALLAEGEVKVVAVEADPVPFSRLGCGFGLFGEARGLVLDGGKVGLHLSYLN